MFHKHRTYATGIVRSLLNSTQVLTKSGSESFVKAEEVALKETLLKYS
ncbi:MULTISPECIES: hypothetical protein [Fischerella]|nr:MULTISPECIES: hypothetical protein [Fischerella]